MRRHLLVCFSFLLVAACEQKAGIHTINPAMGNISGDEVVVIHGAGFTPGMSVRFGERSGTGVVVQGDRITVHTPSGSEGPVDVVVTADDGKSFVLKAGYRYKKAGG